MDMILLTKSSVPIIGQVASIMGWIMDGIYRVLDLVGIQNLGLCIIIFSIIIYALMTPLQVKQQKFSKLSSVMQPELQKIQKKYKDKKDQASVQKMQEETQLVYQKYGVSPTGSCVQLLIQFPVLMALWQVIYKIPGYVGSVKNVFTGLVDQITSVSGYTDLIQSFITDSWRWITEKRPVILSLISFMHYLHLSGKILHQWISLRDLQIPLTPRLQKFPKCRISVD